MEDVFKFLLIAAVIVIGLVKQFKKEAKQNAGNDPAMPMPESDSTMPGDWGGGTYGGYIPEGPKEAPAIKVEEKKSATKPFISGSYVPTTSMGTTSYNKTTSTNQNISPPPTLELEEEDESEFTIQSAEEARRAIVWSEILQRKY